MQDHYDVANSITAIEAPGAPVAHPVDKVDVKLDGFASSYLDSSTSHKTEKDEKKFYDFKIESKDDLLDGAFLNIQKIESGLVQLEEDKKSVILPELSAPVNRERTTPMSQLVSPDRYHRSYNDGSPDSFAFADNRDPLSQVIAVSLQSPGASRLA